MLKLHNMFKVYRTDEVETVALNGVNVEIDQGDFVAVMGPSGCGKSTLLNIVGLLDNPSDGDYFFFDENVAKYTEAQRAQIRKKNIGFIFQSFNLIPELDIFDNVDVPLRYRGYKAAERRRRIERCLDMVGLGSRMKHLPAQLSGGQQQRVAIARALAGEPRFLLADEPTGNLDTQMADSVMALLAEINAGGTTIIMVTHELTLADRAKRNIFVRDGNVSDGYGSDASPEPHFAEAATA